ncbi:MAG: type II toxin-antitoxin system VapC family toxin [Planctomycetaceae bacterium]
MSYLIDTDVCSAHLRQNPGVTRQFSQNIGRLNVSVLTVGELLSWTLRPKTPAKHHHGLLAMLSDVVVLEVTQSVAWEFGRVRSELLDRGQPVAAMDLMIAATALVHGLTVVTHDSKHFAKVPGLAVEDWLTP